MQAKALVLQACRHIQKSFPEVTIAYQYNKELGTHFIRVTPQHVYDSDAFLDFEAELNQLWLYRRRSSLGPTMTSCLPDMQRQAGRHTCADNYRYTRASGLCITPKPLRSEYKRSSP
jgi:hypothetical protein